ncbi:MAG: response regulator transcription factor [Chloroflexota bacterium]|nr:response regulator transcription factor [Chloroflexota bacterium]
MPTILMVSRDDRAAEIMMLAFPKGEFTSAMLPDSSHLPSLTVGQTPDIVLLDIGCYPVIEAEEALRSCREMHLPVMALVMERELDTYNIARGADDFALKPLNPTELRLRAQQLLRRLRGRPGSETIHSDDLVIDQSRYEVTVSGHKVLLTFKEYELLRLLASNPGRVFSREELLSRVWGYEYFGGTRTVDVHVRRLRSKVEDANHVFIETVWNVGYRFKIADQIV